MILTLGILSLVICALFGPFAWCMGKGDLKRIDAGMMDGRDRPLVQGGMICGIIGTAILALSVVGALLWLVVMIAGMYFSGVFH